VQLQELLGGAAQGGGLTLNLNSETENGINLSVTINHKKYYGGPHSPASSSASEASWDFSPVSIDSPPDRDHRHRRGSSKKRRRESSSSGRRGSSSSSRRRR
jgi:hypothetical protein